MDFLNHIGSHIVVADLRIKMIQKLKWKILCVNFHVIDPLDNISEIENLIHSLRKKLCLLYSSKLYMRGCVAKLNAAIDHLLCIHCRSLDIRSPNLLQSPKCLHQSGISPKVVALFSATNFSSYIIELLQLHGTIQIEWNYARIHNNIAIRSHLMIYKMCKISFLVANLVAFFCYTVKIHLEKSWMRCDTKRAI